MESSSSNTQPQVGTPQMSSEFPANTTQTTQTTTTTTYDNNSLFEKEQSLMRWEQDLKLREQNLSSQHTAMAHNANAATTHAVVVPGSSGIRGKPANWPARHPMIRMNVDEDIAIEENRKIFKYASFLFAWETVALIINLAVAIGTIVYSAVGNFFMALFYMLIGIPALWFVTRRLYRSSAAPENGQKSYGFLFTWLGVVAFNIMFFIGLKHSGMNGLVWMISLYHNDHTAVAAMCTVSLFFWFVAMVASIAIFFKVLRMTNTKRQRGEINYAGFRQYIKSR
ncbi:hypothetical protein CYY_008688 [Polysphondylium violaceum]|uniref:Uncharacterized protein n=1 Tax=Polysphondylium violaceum TaxID=133409 RepID=A0A8J4PUS7_9MYCE|nr:hypothetical protein CYY_008688 [Polysphondylium violaceum]